MQLVSLPSTMTTVSIFKTVVNGGSTLEIHTLEIHCIGRNIYSKLINITVYFRNCIYSQFIMLFIVVLVIIVVVVVVVVIIIIM